MIVLVLIACKPGFNGDTTDEDTVDDTEGLTSCEACQSASDIGPAVMVTVRHEHTTPVFF
ncbi:MAG: hypothetical protein R6X02_05180 [Enhygromyxa sp.]